MMLFFPSFLLSTDELVLMNMLLLIRNLVEAPHPQRRLR